LLRLSRTDAIIAEAVIDRALDLDATRQANLAVRIANALGRLFGGR